MDLNSAPRSELIALIYELTYRVELLEGEIARLKEQLHQKGGGPTKTLPDFVKANVKKKKATLRKKRDKAFVPKVDLSATAFGKKRIGVNLASCIATMQDRLRLPMRVIQKYLEIFFQLTLSKGEIVGILQAVAKRGKPTYQNLLAQIRGSPVVAADETGGRENGLNGYFWSLSTPTVHVLLYRKSRGSQVVEEIVGKESEEFDGVLITDFYAAYNTYSGFHQRCWVHLLRDIHDLKREFPKHPPLNSWAKKIKALYEEATSYTGPNPRWPAGLIAQERIRVQHTFEQRLKAICEPYLIKDSPQSTLCGRAISFLPELFTFIRFEGIPSHNNGAERILRHTVIARKIQGGTRSPKGSETKTILTSLFDTWQLQGKNPLAACRLLLAN